MANRSIGNIQQLAEGKYLLRFSAGFDDFGKRIQVSKTVRCANEKEVERLLMEFYKEREKCRDDRIGRAGTRERHNHVEHIYPCYRRHERGRDQRHGQRVRRQNRRK